MSLLFFQPVRSENLPETQSILSFFKDTGPTARVVLGILLFFSFVSWVIIFAKYSQFKSAVNANRAFLRAFRKAPNLDAVAAAAEQFRAAPLTTVFDFGYQEATRQVKLRGEIIDSGGSPAMPCSRA